MKFKNNLFGIAAMALCLGLASCSDDDELQFSQAQVTNSELKTILEQNGLHFDDQGHLLLDEAANNLKALDLSGKKISDYKELSVLPNLVELNLSNNEFGPTFDFSILPTQITAVDLTGNEIYEFNNLVHIEKAENGEEKVTLVRDMSKLYLPESAKHNCVEIPSYFTADKEVDMKMDNAPYTTLREVPDPVLKEFLQEAFSNIFNENGQIDLSKRFSNPTEISKSIVLNPYQYKNKSVEGAQYIIMNPSYKGASIRLTSIESCELPYLKASKDMVSLQFEKVNTTYINTKEAENMVWFGAVDNMTITEIDLSASKKMGQRGTNADGSKEDFNSSNNSSDFAVTNCPELTKILFPTKAEYINKIDLYNLPKLETFDISQLKGMVMLNLGNLPRLKTLKYYTPDGNKYAFGGKYLLKFAISEDVYNLQSTKDFISKYKDAGLSKGFFNKKAAGCPEFDWRKI